MPAQGSRLPLKFSAYRGSTTKMLFSYQYIDSKGHKKKGSLDVPSIVEAKEKLRSQGLIVLSLVEVTGQRRLIFKKKETTLHPEILITFTTQLSQLLTAGMPLYESLVTLEEQYAQEKFQPLLTTLCDQIKGGSSLSEAMGRFPKVFNLLYCSMVAAGESVGTLNSALEKLALLLAKQRKLKKQMVTALIYPALLFSFSLVVLFLLMTFVIPSLEVLFEDRPVNRFTRIVMTFSHFLTTQWMIYLPVILASLGIVCYFFSSSRGKIWSEKQLLRFPLINTLIIQTAIARFSRSMSSLLQGGVSIVPSLQISSRVMNHRILEEIIRNAETKIIQGSLLSMELKKSPLIPSLVPRMLAIGEEGGNTALMLQKIADFYEEEVEKLVARLTALAQPIILITMGGVVGLIMMAVLLPLTDINAFL